MNVSTVGTMRTFPKAAVYTATKAGLDSLTRAWAAEFGPEGVRVNGVAPGAVDTEGIAALGATKGNDALGKGTPAGRMVQPSDIAKVVAFLAGDEAGYLHGETIVADGGFLAT